jgi:hypothetical protein
VQEACLSTARDVYQKRIDEVAAQIPVKTANNTPAGELRGQANAPRGLNPLAPVPAQESAVTPTGALQPPQTPTVPADTIVTEADLLSSDAFLPVCRSMLQSAEMLSLLLVVIFW